MEDMSDARLQGCDTYHLSPPAPRPPPPQPHATPAKKGTKKEKTCFISSESRIKNVENWQNPDGQNYFFQSRHS